METATAYLKSELGMVLARGIAETVTAAPGDPVQYLGMWMLHYLQQKELDEQRKEVYAKQMQEKEEWNKVKGIKKQSAAQLIQREWKAFQLSETTRKTRERLLETKLHELQQEIEEVEDVSEYVGAAAGGEEGRDDTQRTEEEKEKEQEKVRSLVIFKKTQQLLTRQDKTSVGEIKRLQRPPRDLVVVMRCALYLLCNKKPKETKTWQQVRNLIKPSPFITAAAYLDPMKNFVAIPEGEETEETAQIPVAARQAGRKRQFLRVKRVLRQFTKEDPEGEARRDRVKEKSVLAYVILQYLLNAVELRDKRDEVRKQRIDLGKDVEDEAEEEEEEEPTDPSELDDDETREKLREEAERKKQEEEEAKARERGEDDEVPEEGEDS